MKWFRLSLWPSSYHSHLNHPEIWYNSPREIQRSQPKRCEKNSRGSTEFWRDRYEGLSSYNSPSIDLYMISTCCSTKIDFLCLPSSVWQTIHGNKICMISRFEMATCWKEISLQWMKIRRKKKTWKSHHLFSPHSHSGLRVSSWIPGPRWLLWYCGWNPAPMVETQTK